MRYSIYPGRRSLDLIWGHVDHVGEKSDLPAPTLEYLAAQLGETHALFGQGGRALVLSLAQLSRRPHGARDPCGADRARVRRVAR